MRTVAGGNAAQPTSGFGPNAITAVKIEVADASDVLQDLTTYTKSVEYESTTDEIVDAATVVFKNEEGASSLAPLMTATPPVALGRRIVLSINAGSGSYKEIFRGRIDSVDWPERFGDVKVECRDQAGVAADTWVENKIEYSTVAGVDLEDVMQAVADDNLTTSYTLYFPAATSALVQHVADDPPYGPSEQPVLDAERALAESIGWTIRWRNFDASASDWKWTVFEPSRTKTVPDHTFGADDYWNVTQMGQALEDIRNVVEVEYTTYNGARASVVVEDATSIAAYGRRYMKISEASDSPINTTALATSLGNAALSDLKDPDALLEIEAPYFWPGEVGVDLYRFTANDTHFSSDQDLAAMALRHRIAVGERPTTWILTRGKPSGGVLMWKRRIGNSLRLSDTAVADDLGIFNVRETARTDADVTVGWDSTGDIDEIWVWYSTPSQPLASDPWASFTGIPTVRLTSGTTSYTISHPAAGLLTYVQIVPIGVRANVVARGEAHRLTLQTPALDVVPQGSIAIDNTGVPTVQADGPSWAASLRYAYDTSGYPSEATTIASGTTVNGRQMSATPAVALALGESFYVTIIPFSQTGAAGTQGASIRLKATRHDFSATKTVYQPFAMFVVQRSTLTGDNYVDYDQTNNYLINYNWPATYPGGVWGGFAHLDFMVANGTTLTEFGAELYVATDASAGIGFVVDRLTTQGVKTNLGSCSATTFGWQSKNFSVSQTTNGHRFRATVEMSATDPAVGEHRPTDGELRAGSWYYTHTMPSSTGAL